MLGINTIDTASTIVDAYNTVNDHRKDVIAATIANHRSNKDRAGAPVIGAGLGVANSVFFLSVYTMAKAFPKLQKNGFIKWMYDKIDSGIKLAAQNNPNKSKFYHFCAGVGKKFAWSVVGGVLSAAAWDMFGQYLNRRLNGKFSNVKQGNQEDSWLLSGLKSMSTTKQGKRLISDSMRASEDGVKIKFKGVNREYKVSSKEIKDASKQYVTFFDENGKVTGYKKNYSTGDGDVLAFEIALKKYHSDLRNGRIAANSSLPKCANQFSSDDNLNDTDISQIYYFLTGNEPNKIENNGSGENAKLDEFMEDFSNKKSSMAAGFKFKDDGSGTIKVNSKLLKNVSKFSTEKTYAIKKITKHFVTFVDPRNTAVPIMIPTEEFKAKFGEVYFNKFE